MSINPKCFEPKIGIKLKTILAHQYSSWLYAFPIFIQVQNSETSGFYIAYTVFISTFSLFLSLKLLLLLFCDLFFVFLYYFVCNQSPSTSESDT